MKRLVLLCVGIVVAAGGFTAEAFSQESTPSAIKGGVLNGKAVSLPKPAYPAEARAAGLEGTVFVDVVIDESGAVISATAATEPRKVMKAKGTEAAAEEEIAPADSILREAAEKAALQARFSPTLLSGTPVKVSGTIVYNFVVKESALSGGLLNGKAMNLPMPVYPPAAMAVRAEGTVVVRITIDESGNVVEATAVSGHPLLRAAAVEAARSATFAPTRLEGNPVRVSGVLTYNFTGPTKDGSN
ncbi:MAG TPA: energy transducer TonB [Pyrinomonadaceae bacterium]